MVCVDRSRMNFDHHDRQDDPADNQVEHMQAGHKIVEAEEHYLSMAQ